MTLQDTISSLIEFVQRERIEALELDATNRIFSDGALVNLGYAIDTLVVTRVDQDIAILNCLNNESRFRPGDRLSFSRPGQRTFSGVLTNVKDGGRELHVRIGGGKPDVGSGPWMGKENQISLSNSIIDALQRLQPGGPGWGLVKRLFGEDDLVGLSQFQKVEIDTEKILLRLESESEQKLDGSQSEVFQKCMKLPALMGVQGPPGTGKTMLLSFVGEGLVRSGKRIVLLAPTHQAVNNALSAIKRLFPERLVVKVGDELRMESLEAGIPIVQQNKVIREYPSDTLFGMTFMAGLKRLMGGEQRPFDPNVVVIDEAGQLPITQGVCAGLCGAGSIFLFGDDAQMPPVFSGDLSEEDVAISVFAQLRKNHPDSISMLNITHRLNEDLCRHIGKTFYANAKVPLRPSERARDRRLVQVVTVGNEDAFVKEILEPVQSLVWVKVSSDKSMQSNELEAGIVAHLVEVCLRAGMLPEEIAVVTPFRRQARLILNSLNKRFGNAIPLPIVDTVERVQGATVDLVVFSFCASQPEYVVSLANFLFSPNRLNVALSRARRKAIFVSSADVFNVLPLEYQGIVGRNICRGLFEGAHSVFVPSAERRMKAMG